MPLPKRKQVNGISPSHSEGACNAARNSKWSFSLWGGPQQGYCKHRWRHWRQPLLVLELVLDLTHTCVFAQEVARKGGEKESLVTQTRFSKYIFVTQGTMGDHTVWTTGWSIRTRHAAEDLSHPWSTSRSW